MNAPLNKNHYDAIVIGAGHNGLVAAAYLARAGLQVLVVEKSGSIGGATTTEEVFPGFRADTGSFDASLFSPKLVSEFGLTKYGLRFIESPVIAFAPRQDGQALTFWRDPAKNLEEIGRFSTTDVDRYQYFSYMIWRYLEILREIIAMTPPTIPDYQVSELIPWFRQVMKVKQLGQADMMDFLRIIPMPIADVLNEWFENDPLKAILGNIGVRGSMLGPFEAGTAFMFLYNSQGVHEGQLVSSRFVRGGMIQIAEVLANEARDRGTDFLVGVSACEIETDGERIVAVRLENGERVTAKIILSNVNPKQTFFDLVKPYLLNVSFIREVKNIRYRGGLARVILALESLPRFRAVSTRDSYIKEGTLLSGHILVCPDLTYLERAHDDAKYGLPSQNPSLEIAIPTILDPSLAPKGNHLLLINVQYMPYHLRNGTWDEKREWLGKRVVEILDEYVPGIENLVLHRLVLTPQDLEYRLGLPEGQIYHGQMDLDQLLIMRPVPGYAQYRTPITGLYLCGSGAHPGGGVTGLPGYNAARTALKDYSGRR